MSSRRVAIYWLILALFIGFTVAAPVIDRLTRPNYEAEVQRVRASLQSVDSLLGFLVVLEEARMQCGMSQEATKTIGYCRRTDGLRWWSWLSLAEMFPKGVVARGEFIDGRKASEYQVSIQTMGP